MVVERLLQQVALPDPLGPTTTMPFPRARFMRLDGISPDRGVGSQPLEQPGGVVVPLRAGCGLSLERKTNKRKARLNNSGSLFERDEATASRYAYLGRC